MERDLLDRLQENWRRERPELDTSPMGIVGRILVLGEIFKKRATEALAPFGLGYTDLDVLATLRRSGEPYALRPSELLRAVLIQSGSLTACLDRLERNRFIERVETPGDRRGRSVQLTTRGKALVDEAIEARFREAAERILAIAPENRENLECQLRLLLVAHSRNGE